MSPALLPVVVDVLVLVGSGATDDPVVEVVETVVTPGPAALAAVVPGALRVPPPGRVWVPVVGEMGTTVRVVVLVFVFVLVLVDFFVFARLLVFEAFAFALVFCFDAALSFGRALLPVEGFRLRTRS